MSTQNSKEVLDFLQALKNTEPDRHELVLEMRSIVLETHPEAWEKIMYGGIVFFMEDDLFCGIFVSKNHVTIEFSNGHLMSDPRHRLEGKGKYRRHLKIMTQKDIAGKEVTYFVGQAVLVP